MRINLPKQQREQEIAPENVPYAYKRILFKHLHYEKLQCFHDMYYFKFACAFVVTSLWFLHMQHKGIVSDFRIGVITTRISTLLAFVFLIKNGFECDGKFSYYTSQGKKLEKKYQSFIFFTNFTNFGAYRTKPLKINASRRLLLSVLVFICTVIAGIIFCMKTGLWLAIIVAAFSAAVLPIVLFLYFTVTRKLK